jgi:Fe-S cluster assembly protein SufD
MSAKTGIDIQALTAEWTGHTRPWLDEAAVRRRATASLVTPATRESWKYTPLAGMVDALTQAPATSQGAWSGLDQPGVRALSLDTLQDGDLALAQRLLAQCLDGDRHLLADLALLRATGGWLVEVSETPSRPIELTHTAAGTTIVLLALRNQSTVHFIERQDASPRSTQVVLAEVGQGSRLLHHRAALTGDAALWSLLQARVLDQGEYSLDQQAQGGNRRRLETHITLAGRGASATLTGAYLVGAGQHLDQQVVIEHQAPDTTSRQKFHGIGCGKGRSIFSGRIHIHPHASRSDALLSNRNLALHADAEMNTKPELEIYTDDVRCAHGATVGQLSADALFFLTARGLPEGAARTLLAHGFLRECIAGPLTDTSTASLMAALG